MQIGKLGGRARFVPRLKWGRGFAYFRAIQFIYLEIKQSLVRFCSPKRLPHTGRWTNLAHSIINRQLANYLPCEGGPSTQNWAERGKTQFIPWPKWQPFTKWKRFKQLTELVQNLHILNLFTLHPKSGIPSNSRRFSFIHSCMAEGLDIMDRMAFIASKCGRSPI